MAFDPVASQSELFGLEQPGSAPPQKPGFDRAKLMRLIPLVAAAAKGGPGAIEGLLQGYQQAEAQKQQQAQQQAQTDRQSMLDQSMLQDRAFNQDMKLADLSTQQANARAKLMEAFTAASGDLDNADDVRALASQYEQQGRPLGMRPGTFEHQAMVSLTPSKLERKAAEKRINALKGQFGVDKWMTEGAKFTHVVNGRTVPFAELLSMAGMAPDQNAPVQAGELPEQEWVMRGGVVTPITKGTRQPGDRPYQPPSIAQPDYEWVVRNGQPRQIRKGTAQPGDVPYEKGAGVGAAGGAPSAYTVERNARTVQSVDELLKKVSRRTTGIGSLLARIPESEARNFLAELDTLKANIAFNELTEMREASKTGGALGNVSDRELALLTSALGALDPGQSPANLRIQLEKIKASVIRWQAAKGAIGGGVGVAPVPSHGGSARPDPLGIR